MSTFFIRSDNLSGNPTRDFVMQCGNLAELLDEFSMLIDQNVAWVRAIEVHDNATRLEEAGVYSIIQEYPLNSDKLESIISPLYNI